MNPLAAARQLINHRDLGDKTHMRAMLLGMLTGYDTRWGVAQRNITLQSVEATYESPLFNIETMRRSRTFSVAGKVDKVAHQDGLVIYDHKTTSMSIEDPDSPYWRQLIVESQPTHYQLLMWVNGIKIERAIWDVVRKPGIKAKKLPKKDQAAVTSLGVYHGFDVSEKSIDHVVQHETENDELFEHRVAAETIENHHRYFQRRSVPRLQLEMEEYASELWQIACEIRDTRRNNRWYRNPGGCFVWNSPCEYLGICSGHDTEHSDNWTRAENVHEELADVTESRNVLTQSRIKCYQTCRKKHFYRYELGLRRADDEEREALFFGSLWHEALDIYWRESCAQGESDDDYRQRPGIEPGGCRAETRLESGNPQGCPVTTTSDCSCGSTPCGKV